MPLGMVSGEPNYLHRRLTEDAIALCEQRMNGIGGVGDGYSLKPQGVYMTRNSQTELNSLVKSEPESSRAGAGPSLLANCGSSLGLNGRANDV
eukprot:CAMPEP_0185599622 /NCGR_PEP_ID=MMETSP0434-20130131/82828_1 /TAXON_ID=626734 ORGANISM="Favella taraikaensis, Strain Fe Narragansett Bay" /NCGR_SAMPLE_ID=MMETSP0434 /ASSEMBLY_ACC=CAM_ASM_000379 /LENGTH=92 /DNA_ID=CAMNT_0028229087 /DNA_START=806 /DNA_END=1084 /DNA_ORIENTATION=+